MHDTTFIVQGPIHITTAHNLTSIRQHYPKSKIILSTWPNQQLDGLQFDEVVISEDPGSIRTHENLSANTNRLIVSTKNGLERVRTLRAVKTRTDIGILGVCPDLFSDKDGQYFQKKIVGLNLFFRDPFKSNKLFHMGDIFMSGLTKDLLNLWNSPLAEDFQLGRSLRVRIYNKYPVRLAPEQYLWLTFLRRQGIDIDLEYVEDVNIQKLALSEVSLASNFEIKTAAQLGLNIPTRFIENGNSDGIYSQADFERILTVGTDIDAARKIFSKRNRKAILRFMKKPSRWGWFEKISSIKIFNKVN
jgi:hypothetical protein